MYTVDGNKGVAMNKYVKKPIVVEALQWLGDNWEELIDFMGEAGTLGPPDEDNLFTVEIVTLEGIMSANPGDWIIQGVKGEFYPCKPDIFEVTYERLPS